jgi:deoxyribodipyrimidine photo-lyase
MKVNFFWFRRDLRLHGNIGLTHALAEGLPVIPLFILDKNITSHLPSDDARISFIYRQLKILHRDLNKNRSSILIKKGTPDTIWRSLLDKYDINKVFANTDYEPYSIKRDKKVHNLLQEHASKLVLFNDHLIAAPGEILKNDGKPYTVFTPFKNQWLQQMPGVATSIDKQPLLTNNFHSFDAPFPALDTLGFQESHFKVEPFNSDNITGYAQSRDNPEPEGTTRIGPHLRFGTVNIREIVEMAKQTDPVFLNELIWREFFMHILFHFPYVENESFKKKYSTMSWRNHQEEFELWCRGETGYPMVDAGMKQLNKTGYMHNRLRMITAGFLCKHLLIDWRWGEAYFAEKLLDYELSSNNGNWQWAAGTGCDAAPYFRIFNPTTQQKRFDPQYCYIKKWIPDYTPSQYIKPIVDHKTARERAIAVYKNHLHNL